MEITIRGCNTVDEVLVRQVMEDMKRLGPPRVRVLRHDSLLQAIEGTHRLEAARRLGSSVIIDVIADEATDGARLIHDAYGPGKHETIERLRLSHLGDGHNRASITLDERHVEFTGHG